MNLLKQGTTTLFFWMKSAGPERRSIGQGDWEFQEKKNARNVIVAFTGNNTPEDRARLIRAGFDAVVGKPFRLETLGAFLRDPTSRQALEFDSERQQAKDSGSYAAVLRRVGGDETLLRQMIRTFLRQTPKRIKVLGRSLNRRTEAISETMPTH